MRRDDGQASYAPVIVNGDDRRIRGDGKADRSGLQRIHDPRLRTARFGKYPERPSRFEDLEGSRKSVRISRSEPDGKGAEMADDRAQHGNREEFVPRHEVNAARQHEPDQNGIEIARVVAGDHDGPPFRYVLHARVLESEKDSEEGMDDCGEQFEHHVR
jgi:hypothetical protein